LHLCLWAAAGCHGHKPAAPAAAAPARAAPAPDSAQLARTHLEAARELRARIASAEQRPDADTAAIASDAQGCAAEARQSWIWLFPDAVSARDPAAKIGSPGAEALYLEAVCTAAWARMQGFTPLIERRGELMAAFARVAQLAPDLDGGGAERELGALYAALPAYAGGDLEAARRHLLAAIERAPNDPRNHLVLARAVAVKAQDRALFRQHLQMAARSADPAAAAQAEALLQRERELFGPAEAAQPIPGGPQK
jgi:hypothetical protein